MDKNVYETYEFLPTTSPETDSNQFFVLQDDGTILTVQREIQYVTQTEETNVNNLTPTDSSTMFVTPPAQQYYLEFEENTPELISLNDQYSLSNEDSNVYENNYLMQPENTATPQEMETDAVIDPQKLDAQQIQQLNIEAFNGSKQNTNLTEITLTDEQYQILEQKGWLLLEANNKVFVLNTLGLHDITANEKLIHRLKSELLENHTADVDVDQLEETKCYMESVDTVSKNSENAVEYFIQNNLPMEAIDNGQDSKHFITGDIVDEDINVDETDSPIEKQEYTEVPVLNNSKEIEDNSPLEKKCDTIKIKTKYTFTDVPDKIFLGKTVNGKNLYAKVKMKVNSQAPIVNPLLPTKALEKKTYESSVLDAATFLNIVQTWFRGERAPSAACVQFAEAVITQLMRLPNFNDCIIQGNLVITKVVTTHSAAGRDIEQPTVVTGFMKIQDDDYVFVHAPNMLREILQDAEYELTRQPNNPTDKSKGVIELFHIHVSESRFTDKPPETAIHLSKRKIPIEPLKDAKKKHPNPSFACAICGAVFQTEQLLKDHQDDECIEVEDGLTIDYAEDLSDQTILYTVANVGNGKIYTCTLCDTKFTRLYNCKKHVKAHQEGKEKKLRVYKCKMCSNSYFHPSTLSKHIVKTHIQAKLNT